MSKLPARFVKFAFRRQKDVTFEEANEWIWQGMGKDKKKNCKYLNTRAPWAVQYLKNVGENHLEDLMWPSFLNYRFDKSFLSNVIVIFVIQFSLPQWFLRWIRLNDSGILFRTWEDGKEALKILRATLYLKENRIKVGNGDRGKLGWIILTEQTVIPQKRKL